MIVELTRHSFCACWVLLSLYIPGFLSLRTASDLTNPILVSIITARHEEIGSLSVSVAAITSRCFRACLSTLDLDRKGIDAAVW